LEIKWFSNLKMTSKLLVGFALVLAVNAALGLFCLQRLSVVHEAERDLAVLQIPSLQALTELRSSVNAHRRGPFEYVVAWKEGQRREAEKHLRDAAVGIQSAREKYGSLVSNAGERRLFKDIKNDLLQYLAVRQQTMGLARAPSRIGRSKRRSKPANLSADLLFGPEAHALGKVISTLQSAEDVNLRFGEAANRDSMAV
jgi:Four helix bundle sensory module for signal transduction